MCKNLPPTTNQLHEKEMSLSQRALILSDDFAIFSEPRAASNGLEASAAQFIAQSMQDDEKNNDDEGASSGIDLND